MKPKRAVILVGLLLVILAATTVFADDVTQIFLDKDNHNVEQVKATDGQALIKVMDEVITSKKFLSYKNDVELITGLNKTNVPADEVLLKRYVLDVLLVSEAKALHLEASYEEAVAYVDEIRKLLDRDDQRNFKQFQDELIHSMGLSEEQYWMDIAIPSAQVALSKDRLMEKLISDGTLSISVNQEERKLAKVKYEQELINKNKDKIKILHLEPELRERFKAELDTE